MDKSFCIFGVEAMKYRIKHVDMVGYFAQVRHNLLSGWKTIGEHNNNQTGEYPEDHLNYPLRAQHEAVLLAHKHADFNKAKKGFTHYRDMML